jgi:hypothetical protein
MALIIATKSGASISAMARAPMLGKMSLSMRRLT